MQILTLMLKLSCNTLKSFMSIYALPDSENATPWIVGALCKRQEMCEKKTYANKSSCGGMM